MILFSRRRITVASFHVVHREAACRRRLIGISRRGVCRGFRRFHCAICALMESILACAASEADWAADLAASSNAEGKLCVGVCLILNGSLKLLLKGGKHRLVLGSVDAQLQFKALLFDHCLCARRRHKFCGMLALVCAGSGGGSRLSGQDTLVREHLQNAVCGKGAGVRCGNIAVSADIALIMDVAAFRRYGVRRKIFRFQRALTERRRQLPDFEQTVWATMSGGWGKDLFSSPSWIWLMTSFQSFLARLRSAP